MDDMIKQAVDMGEDYNAAVKKLAQAVANKKIVGAGESTHGTHEFFQLKSDLFIELVKNHDFRIFALEDEPKKCEAIHHFINTGEGELDQLTKPLYVVWRTKEMRSFITKLRQLASSYNISFVGIDADDSELTEKPGKPMFEQRDSIMAKNTMRVAKRGKTFVWGHNSHISKQHLDVQNLGWKLSEKLGDTYAAIGLFFGQGTFSARRIKGDQKMTAQDYNKIPLSSIAAPAAKKGSLEYLLNKASFESYFIDLLAKPKLDILSQKYKCRAFGAIASEDSVDKFSMSVQPYNYYTALVYFKHTKHTTAIN
ncbi:MAG: erythromycin esterase family protein [Actinobacteria bacterium]|nr:erythromycin esterase family protein [Actinomycetota bacterium]